MAKYKVSDTDLSSIADAIRTKGSTSASLEFPDGFVTAIDNISTGQQPTLVTKSITANGIYNASYDDADGYSSVTVSIAPRYVTGTFTGTTAGAAMTVNVPYTGSGYPIAIVIHPTGGSFNPNSTFYSTVQKLAECDFFATKSNTNTAPDYTSNSATENKYDIIALYKYSDSDATIYTDGRALASIMAQPNPASATSSSCVRFNSSTSMSVYIASTSYGFMKDIEYTYWIIYSS